MKYSLCSFPECSGYVTDKGRKIGLCNKHFEMLRFFLWAMDNIKVKDKSKTTSGIILP